MNDDDVAGLAPDCADDDGDVEPIMANVLCANVVQFRLV